MFDVLRDAPLGQIVRYLSGDKLFLYPEERPDFVLPPTYTQTFTPGDSTAVSTPVGLSTPEERLPNEEPAAQPIQPSRSHPDPEKLEKLESTPIVPDHLKDGTILVDWYTTDDPANPQNWSTRKKGFVALQIWYLSHTDLANLTVSILLPFTLVLLSLLPVNRAIPSLVLLMGQRSYREIRSLPDCCFVRSLTVRSRMYPPLTCSTYMQMEPVP